MQVGYQQVANGSMPMVQNVSCVLPETEDRGGLYIGNYFGAKNIDLLKERGIRAVLTTSVETPISYLPEQIPFHMRIEAHDRQNFSIGEHFEKCLKFIEQSRKHTNILVHCYAGVSRSSSIVLAYLMKYQGWTFDTALNFLKHKRSVVNPNEGFKTQLREYERNLSMTGPIQSVSLRSSENSIKQQQQETKQSFEHVIPSPTLMKRSFVGLVHKHQPTNLPAEVTSPRFQQSLNFLPQSNYQTNSRTSLGMLDERSTSITKRQKEPISTSFKHLPTEIKERNTISTTTKKSIETEMTSNMAKKQQVMHMKAQEVSKMRQLQNTVPLNLSRNFRTGQSSQRKINI